jgi:uncharacterized protein YdhG (YjbR/CyaY superfamily)
MKAAASQPVSIDEYIAAFPPEVAGRLAAMRATIREHAPDAEERIAYRMPTFWQGGNLVHFAAFANHIGFYPAPSGIAAFAKELARYPGAKGSVQFPHDEPLPLALVAKIVDFRVKENAAAGTKKGSAARRKRPAE